MLVIIWSTWGYLTFLMCEYYISQQCVCSEFCTNTHRHVVLIIGRISKETHPLSICCPPPVKIFLLIYNNSLQTFLQPQLDWDGGNLCYQSRSSGVACWVLLLTGHNSFSPTTDSLSISIQCPWAKQWTPSAGSRNSTTSLIYAMHISLLIFT